MAAWEKVNAQLLADQGYWALLNEAADLFVDGGTHDTLLQSLLYHYLGKEFDFRATSL